jgi:formylglycine-generating enzyme required for sulfatase activity
VLRLTLRAAGLAVPVLVILATVSRSWHGSVPPVHPPDLPRAGTPQVSHRGDGTPAPCPARRDPAVPGGNAAPAADPLCTPVSAAPQALPEAPRPAATAAPPQGPARPPARAAAASQAQRALEPAPAESWRDCPGCPELVMIPAGRFLMGSPDDQGDSDEHPQHPVTVAAFALGKYEVTYEEWDTCVSAGGCSSTPADSAGGRGRHPVVNVSWDDAREYVRWLSRRTGHPYRLPSEAEWEYAARAGSTAPYYWGDDLATGHCQACDSPVRPVPVDSFPPNAFGVYDMAGNVSQWTQDRYHDSYLGAPADARAWENGDYRRGPIRVIRGGNWSGLLELSQLRPAYRSVYTGQSGFIGLRVARTL